MYIIKVKSEVLEVFKRFKINVERESGKLVKILRTDGGGEYTSYASEKFCQDSGIAHEVTAPYTPQHNSLAKRKNRTIMYKELNFWGDVVSTTVHILNRCPTKRLAGKVPLEVWIGTKPYVNYFKVFGSLAFSHVADQRRSKLEDKGEAMVFIGYHPTSTYKLYDPIKEKMVISRDVIVLEDEN